MIGQPPGAEKIAWAQVGAFQDQERITDAALARYQAARPATSVPIRHLDFPVSPLGREEAALAVCYQLESREVEPVHSRLAQVVVDALGPDIVMEPTHTGLIAGYDRCAVQDNAPPLVYACTVEVDDARVDELVERSETALARDETGDVARQLAVRALRDSSIVKLTAYELVHSGTAVTGVIPDAGDCYVLGAVPKADVVSTWPVPDPLPAERYRAAASRGFGAVQAEYLDAGAALLAQTVDDRRRVTDFLSTTQVVALTPATLEWLR